MQASYNFKLNHATNINELESATDTTLYYLTPSADNLCDMNYDCELSVKPPTKHKLEIKKSL